MKFKWLEVGKRSKSNGFCYCSLLMMRFREMVSLIPRLSSFAVSGTPAKTQIADLIHVLKYVLLLLTFFLLVSVDLKQT